MNRSSDGVAAVIPAYNEASTIHRIAAGALEYVPRVVVVDDGSSDDTADRLRGLPVTILRQPGNLGKAAALWRGAQHAIALEADAIITLDGDGQHNPQDIPALIAMHRRNSGAIILGSRRHHAGKIPLVRYLANRLADFWISSAGGRAVRDSQSGFRIYPADVLRVLGARCDRTAGFVFESEILIEAGRHGVPIHSVPISVEYGRHLRRSHFRQVRDVSRITRMVTRKLLGRRREISRPPEDRIEEATLSPTAPSVSRRAHGSSFRRRILFVAESVSLAHVARTVALARTLDPELYDLHMACDPRYLPLFGSLHPTLHHIRSITSEQFQERLRTGSPLYSSDELRAYVSEELRLLADLNPHAVVGDFRLSLSVSARVVRIPYLTVTNAHWSPYAPSRYVVPELTMTDRLGVRAGQWCFDLIRPLIFVQQSWALNNVRREYGLPSLDYTLPHVFTDADETLYADLPKLVPTFDCPAHHHYIGPVLWSPPTRPSWWKGISKDRPIVYVSLGSTGPHDLLNTVLETLEVLGLCGMVSTAGKPAPSSIPDHVFLSPFVPGLEAAERSALIICNGGSATVYQALTAGIPVLGIPSNLDQFLMMEYAARAGTGAYVRPREAAVQDLAPILHDLLTDPEYRSKAETFKGLIRSGDGCTSLDAILRRRLNMNSNGDASSPAERRRASHDAASGSHSAA
ncbi:hypothetical protein W02_28630 [Nitrospira sp. KM1]|uniref:glycosyltransferase n=1 Tax=Nitrospira sp. KM1 TaxID=1936990 RepID=UPI0013A773ED|nr:glycosyltransferase [Nitrospira sp. KM1]BCA55723.1 hypothetical protein W02_28630 [Nitrospira sp. KM1]